MHTRSTGPATLRKLLDGGYDVRTVQEPLATRAWRRRKSTRMSWASPGLACGVRWTSGRVNGLTLAVMA